MIENTHTKREHIYPTHWETEAERQTERGVISHNMRRSEENLGVSAVHPPCFKMESLLVPQLRVFLDSWFSQGLYLQGDSPSASSSLPCPVSSCCHGESHTHLSSVLSPWGFCLATDPNGTNSTDRRLEAWELGANLSSFKAGCLLYCISAMESCLAYTNN